MRTWIVALALAAFGMDAEAAVQAYRPADPNQVVLRIGSNSTEATLARLRQASVAEPANADALLRYSQALIERGAATGSERYYGYAEQALHDAPAAIKPNVALLNATVLQHRHDFRAAEFVLNDVLTRDPRNTEARLMRAQIRLHLHEPGNAMRDCVALVRAVDLLTSTTCIAQARAARGDIANAYALVLAVLQSSSNDATRSWSAGVAGELAARVGDNDAAHRWYLLSYELDSSNHFPRLAYADWLLSQSDFSTALAVASKGAAPADRLRVALAQHNANSREAEQLQLAWQEAAARGERNHLRDQARFELLVLHDAKRAHATALDNFSDHQEPDDALLLAATAMATHDHNALLAIQSWKTKSNYRDVRIDRAVEQRQ